MKTKKYKIFIEGVFNERDSDVKFLEMAGKVFDKILSDIGKSRYDDWYQKDIPLLHSNDAGGFMGRVSLEDLDIEGLPSEMEDFWMFIGSPKDDDEYSGTKAGAVYTKTKYGSPAIKIYVKDQILDYLKKQDLDDDMKKKILLSQHRSTFVHEFAHFLDDKTTGGKHSDTYHKKSGKSEKDYYNATHEVNAHFRGYLSQIEDEGVMDISFDKFKEEFWDEFDGKEELEPATIKKMNSRLYTAWDKLREKYRKQWDDEMAELEGK